MKLQGKRVLVTGGAGFIGSHTVEALSRAGATVVVFDNFSTGKRENLGAVEAVDIIHGDVRDFAEVRTAMRNADAVVHLAAQVSVRASIDDPLNSSATNVTGFINVLEAARHSDVRRVVYASSAAVYGLPATLPLDETSSVGPISPYGLEKLIDEQYASMYQSLYRLPCLGLRYFNVYGSRQDPSSPYAGVISKFIHRLRVGEPLTIFGTGEQTRDFVDVRDIARVNVAAVEGEKTGVLAVGTGRSVTLLQLVDVLARCLNRVPEVRHESAVHGDIPHSSMVPHELRRAMGCVPEIPLEEGLDDLIRNVPSIG